MYRFGREAAFSLCMGSDTNGRGMRPRRGMDINEDAPVITLLDEAAARATGAG